MPDATPNGDRHLQKTSTDENETHDTSLFVDSCRQNSVPRPTTSQGWVGGYHLLRKIGSGGTGTVWEASDEGGNRVALKLLHPSVADTDPARKRLLREARLVNRIRSDGVSRVLDVEADALNPFVVTELVEGPTLGSLLKNGGLSSRQVLDLALDLADILDSIHSEGVAHRDLKPSNVVVGMDGPVLIDFGIAHSAQDTKITKSGSVMGTPGYVAPEILLDSSDLPIEHWQNTDWFGWVASLLSASTGRPPFGSGTADGVLYRVFEGEPDTFGLPLTLSDAFRMALHPDPTFRASPDTLLTVLENEVANPTIELYEGTLCLPDSEFPGQNLSPIGEGFPRGDWSSNSNEPRWHQYPPSTFTLSVLLLLTLGWIPASFGFRFVAVGISFLFLAQFAGRIETHLARRRNQVGGARPSDFAVMWLVSPWCLLTATFVWLPSLVAGAFIYFSVLTLIHVVSATIFGMTVNFECFWNLFVNCPRETFSSWQLGLATTSALLAMWGMPSSKWCRIGVSRLISSIASTSFRKKLLGGLLVTIFVFLVVT